METVDDYAAEVEQHVRSAVAHAMLVFKLDPTQDRLESADWLDVALEAVERGINPVEVAMERKGLTSFTDRRDGLRYVTSEVAA